MRRCWISRLVTQHKLNPRIPVFTDDPGWHGKRLKEAFAARGLEAVFVSLKDCHLDLTHGKSGVYIPGFDQLPDGAFVRGVPGGTLPQVILRLDVLHALKALGVLVYNGGRAVERTVDKAMTSFLLHLKGIPTPQTWVSESPEQASAIVQLEIMAGRELVLKPLFGSQGIGLRRLGHDSTLPELDDQDINGVYYLQSYVDSGEGAWHDHRVFIINGKVVAAMIRHGNHWINNVAQGGRCEFLPPSGAIPELALAAANAVDIDYCGVDIIRDHQGRLYVLEVNSIPAWKGLQSVAGLDIARALVDDFLAKLDARSGATGFASFSAVS